ncbi:MAG: hypothetical protein IH944_06770 [Armatimonadetes bacterium]|nr:hypothetical protein [Armatimonadota bacterium]
MVDRRFRKALKSVRATAPTTGIETVYARYRVFDRPVKRIKGAALYSALALIPVLVTVATLLLSQPAKAVTLADMADALESENAVHITYRFVDSGIEGDVYREEWREGTKYRRWSGLARRIPRSDSGFDGRRSWRVDFEGKNVEIGIRLPGNQINELETIDDIIKRYRLVSRENPKIERKVVNGMETLVFQAHLKYDYSPFRIEVTADPETSLPIEQKKFSITSQGKWVLQWIVRFEYPDDIPDEVFEPQVPEGFVAYDCDKIVRDLLAGFKGDAPKQTVKGIEIVLLGAFQERDGTVRILWTGGAVPPLFAEAAVFDTSGKQHLVDFWFEDDDRTRERNYGIPPENPPPRVAREDIVVKLRPMGFHKGEPYYCLQFNPGRVEPNQAVTYNVVIPVCEPVEPYIQKPGEYVAHRASGKQVGYATFRVTTIPVRGWGFVITDQIDPDHLFVTGRYSAKNIGITQEEEAALRKERRKRVLEKMRRQAGPPPVTDGK